MKTLLLFCTCALCLVVMNYRIHEFCDRMFVYGMYKYIF